MRDPGPGASAVVAALRAHGVVPVVRFDRTDDARAAVELLHHAGYRTFEITLTVPGAIELVAELSAREGWLLGLGTVLDPRDAERGLAAGARYVVSPVLVPELVPVCRAADAACLLGALTPGEVHRAWVHGADAVKVFPANSAGGPAHVRALRSVLPDVPLVPTGGVDHRNLTAYLDAGAAFVGVGSDLVSERALHAGDEAAILAHARGTLDTFRHWAGAPQETP